MTPTAASAQRVVVLAARSRDAELAKEFVGRAGLDVSSFRSFDALIRDVAENAVDCIVLVEEAIPRPSLQGLAEILARQPPWSDLPIVLFTGRFGGTTYKALNALGANVTLLERPVRISTLMQAVQSALRARRRQYEFRDLLRRLEDSDRRKDEFLAMLGHELRNPLAAIHNALHVLEHHPSREVAAKQPQVIARQSLHLARLVDDLLDVSRVTMGKINLERVRVDLNDLAARCVQALMPLADEERHALTIAPAESELVVEGDQVRLEQVLANLVTNAIKYTPSGGRITVTVERDGACGRVSVRDSGIGIPGDMLPRIFQLFTQLEQSLDRSRGGLGLGLSLCQSLVERHGGTIEARSDGPGCGSEFIVRLPLAAAPAALDARAPEPPSDMRPLRIAVIEDNDDARESTVAMLELHDHQVFAAADGVEGLELVLRQRPDVALVDIGLPRLNGYELARRVRASGEAYDPKLIAMTGYGQPEDKRRALECGFDAHVAKPVRAVDLLRLVNQKRSRAITAS